MSRTDQQRIRDILDACDELANVVSLHERGSLPALVLSRAAERLLEIIGEASTALTDQTRDLHPNVAWRDITRMRTFLAHHYQRVDDDQVWTIATTHVPHLAGDLRSRPSAS